uniref:Uncharacterized protein n=1 Tax=Anguilla anguilla TaxID=7936 RepID=A0A0E9X6W0_ANGAN
MKANIFTYNYNGIIMVDNWGCSMVVFFHCPKKMVYDCQTAAPVCHGPWILLAINKTF